ncbi:MAG: nitroreductase family deazaflavin-dependent oxidoreductase [Proteobacteria bacterium]|nr:nitroreductase family deazaflavin-dependent oxidoreductase [Pseudomonadota bacterium]
MHRLVFKTLTALNNALYRWSGGRLGGRFGKAPIFLLTVRGRRSGRPFTVPLLYLVDGGDYIIVGSKAGDAKHPDWYLNLEANPEAQVQIGERFERVRAETVAADEKARLWPCLVEMYADFESYQKWAAGRDIPVVRLRVVKET